MSTSIKKNFLYSSILTSANYIFPLLVYPYVSRLLGPTYLGTVNFIDSIVYYFILISMMGISTLGIREVASYRNDSHKLNSIFSSLIVLNSLTTLVGIVILALVTYFVPQLWAQRELMFFGGIKLLFSYLCLEWLYKGLEEFRFVTIRTITIKCCFVIAVYIFVRHANSYAVYYLLMVLMIVANAIINIVYSRHFVSFSFKNLDFRKIIKPYFVLGFYILLTSMYTTFNVTYLGFVAGDTQVGYYTTATKIYMVLIAFFTALTGVMLPRMSALVSEGKMKEFGSYFFKSTGVLLSLTIPLILFTLIFAPQIVYLISGPGYAGAILPMRIVMPLAFIIGYEQILVIQTLMPLKADKVIFRNSLIGAIVGLFLNIILVKWLASSGSAIVWVISELTILILSQIGVTRLTKLTFPYRLIGKAILSYLPVVPLLFVCASVVSNPYIQLLLGTTSMMIYFFIAEIYFIKNPFILGTIFKIREKL